MSIEITWSGISVFTWQHDCPVIPIKAAIQLHFGQWEICEFNGLLSEDISVPIIKSENGTIAHDIELGNREVVIYLPCQMRCHSSHQPVALRMFS